MFVLSLLLLSPVRIASARISLIFVISDGIVKIFLKTMKRKKSNLKKIALLARNKLYSIKILCKTALIDCDISHDEFCPID